ncbi:MAG: hypothetical protein WBP85_02320 [Terracidiphilus sp.]
MRSFTVSENDYIESFVNYLFSMIYLLMLLGEPGLQQKFALIPVQIGPKRDKPTGLRTEGNLQ